MHNSNSYTPRSLVHSLESLYMKEGSTFLRGFPALEKQCTPDYTRHGMARHDFTTLRLMTYNSVLWIRPVTPVACAEHLCYSCWLCVPDNYHILSSEHIHVIFSRPEGSYMFFTHQISFKQMCRSVAPDSRKSPEILGFWISLKI